MAHGRGTPLAGLIVGSLGLGDALGQDLSVLVLHVISLLCYKIVNGGD
mgnify:CR=1 FL=1